MEQIDVAIAGGGIVGLWIAHELLKKHPHFSVVVFEKEQFFGEHATGRNSEVLHAGIYYDYQTLKHVSCLEGNVLWREFFKLHQLNFLDCGKYIVSPLSECEELDSLLARAKRNQVPDIRYAHSGEIEELGSWVRCKSALYSPSSAVIDVPGSVKLLKHLIAGQGGILLSKTELKVLSHSSDGFYLEANNDLIKSQILINAAGYWSVEFREMLGLVELEEKMVKGSYLALRRPLGLKQLIYPLPPKDGLGLGVHLTLNVSGEQKFGPNVEPVDYLDYSVSEELIELMYPAIKSLFPTVEKEYLALAYAGIRPRISDKKDNLIKDFILNTPIHHKIPNYFEFLGVESPGLTAAPALAKLLVRTIL